MKILFKIVFSVLSLCISTAALGQNLSDKEIGLDVDKITQRLKERGADDQYIQQKISMKREVYKKSYAEMKKLENEILHKISASTNKGTTSRSALATSSTPALQKEALQAFYISTNGQNWTNNAGWDFNTPLVSWNPTTQTGWYGLSVDANGNVTSINMANNNVTGPLPTEIGNLTELRILNLSNNNISGTIPAEIDNLNLLLTLALDNNDISGTIPSQITNLTNLLTLRLGNNQALTGTIPDNIGAMSNLGYLEISLCDLNGPIPSSIGSLANLSTLRLENNKLSGSIPNTFGNLTKLRYFNLYNNKITGIPSQISGLIALQSIDISECINLTGNLPVFPNSPDLYYYDFGACKFSGTIPAALSQNTKLQYILLNNNLLQGQVPSQFSNLTKLINIDISNNRTLSGVFPDLTNTTVRQLSIHGNSFRFIDFINEFPTYLINCNTLRYDNQAKIDTPIVENKAAGQLVTMTMCTDDRFHGGDTYQWYKNGVAIPGATNRIYTINSLTTAHAGSYVCRSFHLTGPNMSQLTLEREPITLNVISCPALTATINPGIGVVCEKGGNCQYECGDFILNPWLTNINTSADLNNATYSWKVKNSAGTVLHTANTVQFNYQLTTPGDYTIELVLTTTNGCQYPLSTSVTVIACSNCYPVVGQIKVTRGIIQKSQKKK